MKKLTLDLDSLDVASFDTTSAREETRGTVAAHSSSWITIESSSLLTPSIVAAVAYAE